MVYVCLVAGVEVARFIDYREAVEYMNRCFGRDWQMYDYGIVEQYDDVEV